MGFCQTKAINEDILSLNTYLGDDILEDLFDLVCDLGAVRDDRLDRAAAHNIPQRRLCALNEGAVDVLDAVCSAVRVRDVPVDDAVHLDADIVARSDTLLWHADELDLDVDNAERLAARVDLDKTRVYTLVELAELRGKGIVKNSQLVFRVAKRGQAFLDHSPC